MPGSILDVMFHLNLIEHGKVNLCYPGCKQLHDLHILRSKIMFAHIEQQAPHATSKPPTVGQWTTYKNCYFRIELAFQYCMKIPPCYYAVSAHLASNILGYINKRFYKRNWLKFGLSFQSLNFGKEFTNCRRGCKLCHSAVVSLILPAERPKKSFIEEFFNTVKHTTFLARHFISGITAN